MIIQKKLSIRAIWELTRRYLPIVLGMMFCCGAAHAQDEDEFQFEKKISISSGKFDGNQRDYVSVYTTRIGEPDVPWMRIHFKKWNLGESSYIQMTSMKDGGMQRLDVTSIEQWGGYSAYFSGDEIELELFAAPEDNGVFVRVDGLIAGKWQESETGDVSVKSLCGDDDRVRSSDPAIGRFFRIRTAHCTVWLTMDALITAGHCEAWYLAGYVVEFNVKDSTPGGTNQPSDPDDQYVVVAGSGVFRDGDPGDDWGIFEVHPNSNTHLLPIDAQNAFYRVSDVIGDPDDITITGCGEDDGIDDRTQQTDSGPGKFAGCVDYFTCTYTYEVDTQNGNSGSPVIETASNIAMGIHVAGGCPNVGTGFQNYLLSDTMVEFNPQFVFVDPEHPESGPFGNVFEPFQTVTDGVNYVESGGSVRVAGGVYDEPTLIIDRPMEIDAVAGEVTLNDKLTIKAKSTFEVARNGAVVTINQ